MKKTKQLMGALAKGAAILSPGIASVLCLHEAHGWPVSILAAMGMEFGTCLILTFITAMTAQIKAHRESAADPDGPAD